MHLLHLKLVSSSYFAIYDILLYSIESGLNRLRRKTTAPLPTSNDFEIPDTYKKTLNDELFICTDKIINKQRMIIFATDKQLELLFSSEWIFVDGTFDKCPKQFKQIYTIHRLKFRQSEFKYNSKFLYFSFLF